MQLRRTTTVNLLTTIRRPHIHILTNHDQTQTAFCGTRAGCRNHERAVPAWLLLGISQEAARASRITGHLRLITGIR
jgi:hypothetical protein